MSESSVRAQESRDPNLEFRALKNLSYSKRMLAVMGLSFLGLLLQVGFLSFLAGAPFLLAAVILGWVVGFDNKLDRRALHPDTSWETVPIDRLESIYELDRKTRKWDMSGLDITSTAGIIVFLFLGGLLATGFLVGSVMLSGRVALILVGDAAILVLSQWFSGMRQSFRQPDLLVKVRHLLTVLHELEPEIAQRGELRAQLLMQGNDEHRLPTDARVSVKYKDAPASFYGVQAQVVLNRVQGTPYPYCYAVVVTEEGHRLAEHAFDVSLPDSIDLETKNQKGVDVAVIRQHTTKTSGYHTKPAASAQVLRKALMVADRHLKVSQG